jgi:predicted peptidase
MSIFAVALLTACGALSVPEPQPAPVRVPIRTATDTQASLASGTWVSPEGTRVRFSIVVPPMSPGDRVPLVLALHGQASTRDTVPPWFGQRSLESLYGPALRPLGAIIVAPDAPKNNWTDPVAERAMLDLMEEMKTRYPIDTMRTLVTGHSMGGMGSWFLVNRHPKAFRAAVPLTSFPLVRHTPISRAGLGAAFDAMAKDNTGAWTAPYRDVPVYAIHSRHDESVPFAAESTLVAMIKARGGLVEFVAVDSLTHGPAILYQGALRGAVPWIRRQWDRP